MVYKLQAYCFRKFIWDNILSNKSSYRVCVCVCVCVCVSVYVCVCASMCACVCANVHILAVSIQALVFNYVFSWGPLLWKSTTQLTVYVFRTDPFHPPATHPGESHQSCRLSYFVWQLSAKTHSDSIPAERDREGTELGVKPAAAAAGRAKPIEWAHQKINNSRKKSSEMFQLCVES